jgi:hypothetical protein
MRAFGPPSPPVETRDGRRPAHWLFVFKKDFVPLGAFRRMTKGSALVLEVGWTSDVPGSVLGGPLVLVVAGGGDSYGSTFFDGRTEHRIVMPMLGELREKPDDAAYSAGEAAVALLNCLPELVERRQ